MKFLIALFLILGILLGPRPVLADDSRFLVNFDVNYKVREDGTTTVTQNFDFTNLTTEFFASEYIVNLNNAQVFNLRAFDQYGPLVLTQTNKQIHIKFRNPVVGQGKSLHFSLAYESQEVAKKVGRIWEIFIPKPDDFNQAKYSVELYVPSSFGEPIYQKPKSASGSPVWDKDEIGPAGITTAYSPGNDPNPYQSYDFRLKYDLFNPKLYSIYTQIALPPDTNYQKIFLKQLSVPPIDMEIDQDGNWLAKYFLAPRSSLIVMATGSAAVFLKPTFPTSGTAGPEDNLSAKKYWEKDDSGIVNRANSLTSPAKIYDFVVSNLTYDSNRLKNNLKRTGAAAVLNLPNSAICLEFTDLFIALSRAAGIPARELDGFGLTFNQLRQPLSLGKDVLHAWPEYFDRKTNSWVMVDPTWGNTTRGTDYFETLDFDHLVLAIHGQNSENPLPAGSYKNKEEKTIDIVPSGEDLDVREAGRLKISAEFPKKIDAFFPSQGQISIENLGPTKQGKVQIWLNSDSVEIDNPIIETNDLPPFAKKQFKISIKAKSLFNSRDGIISLKTSGVNQVYQISIVPISKSGPEVLLGGLILIGFISTITQITRRLFLQK